MIGLLLLASALLLGVGVVWRLQVPLYPFEQAALAVVLGLFGWTWLVFVPALLWRYSVAVPLACVAAFGVAVALIVPARHRRPAVRDLAGGRRAWALWAGATAVSVAVLGRLFWTHSLVRDSDGVWSAGSSWADYGLHAALVSRFAATDRMSTELPVASGEPLTYPHLIDLLSALFLRADWSLHLSFFVPGLLLALACVQLLIAFSLRLFAHLGVAVAGTFLVLTTGTAAGTTQAFSDWRSSGRGPLDFLGDLPRDYTVLGDRNGNVTNLVANALLPQRGFLFGLGVALSAFICLHAHRAGGPARLLYLAGVLIGLLPMAHPHSFLAAGAVLLALAIEAAVRTRALPWAHLGAGGVGLVLAAPQLAWQQLAGEGGTGGRWRWAWMKEPDESVLGYWAVNFGVMGLVMLAVPAVLWRLRRTDLLVWCLPFLALLAVSQLYAFQPFEYDNLKLIYYAYLMAGLFGAYLVMLAIRRTRAAWPAALALIVVVSVPGTLSIAREFQLRDRFAGPEDIALAEWVRHSTDPDAVFLTTDRPNNPISALAGRPLVLGYTGWLFNYNIDYAGRVAAARRALAGQVGAVEVQRYAPDFLAVETRGSAQWPVDWQALAGLRPVYANPGWKVYRVAAR